MFTPDELLSVLNDLDELNPEMSGFFVLGVDPEHLMR